MSDLRMFTALLVCILAVFAMESCAPRLCRGDNDCTSARPRCYVGVCKECINDADCASGTCVSGQCTTRDAAPTEIVPPDIVITPDVPPQERPPMRENTPGEKAPNERMPEPVRPETRESMPEVPQEPQPDAPQIQVLLLDYHVAKNGNFALLTLAKTGLYLSCHQAAGNLVKPPLLLRAGAAFHYRIRVAETSGHVLVMWQVSTSEGGEVYAKLYSSTCQELQTFTQMDIPKDAFACDISHDGLGSMIVGIKGTNGIRLSQISPSMVRRPNRIIPASNRATPTQLRVAISPSGDRLVMAAQGEHLLQRKLFTTLGFMRMDNRTLSTLDAYFVPFTNPGGSGPHLDSDVTKFSIAGVNDRGDVALQWRKSTGEQAYAVWKSATKTWVSAGVLSPRKDPRASSPVVPIHARGTDFFIATGFAFAASPGGPRAPIEWFRVPPEAGKTPRLSATHKGSGEGHLVRFNSISGYIGELDGRIRKVRLP